MATRSWVLMAALALAGLVWVLERGLGPAEPAAAAAPSAPTQAAAARGVAPAPPPLQAAPAALQRYELVGLRRNAAGRPFALIAGLGAPPRAHGLGDSLGPGVRLARIAEREVEIERGLRRERLGLPEGQAGLPRLEPRREPQRLDNPDAVLPRPVDQAPPSSTPLERAIERARQLQAPLGRP